jgi:hypothetical protein
MRLEAMLSRLAHLLLVATSLSPVLLIFGVSELNSDERLGAICIICSLLLAVICHLVLWVAARSGELERVRVTRTKSLDHEAVLFVVSYALPLLVPEHRLASYWALGTFVSVVFVVLYSLQVAHVNPLLAIFGYHFFEISPATGETAMLITRGNPIGTTARVVKLSDHIWLDLGEK